MVSPCISGRDGSDETPAAGCRLVKLWVGGDESVIQSVSFITLPLSGKIIPPTTALMDLQQLQLQTGTMTP